MLLKFFRRVLWEWLPAFLRHIPILQCLTSFSASEHKTAFKKFIIMWLCSTSPVIWAALLSPIPEGGAGAFEKLLLKMAEAFSASEQYVYAASFITPVLYIIYERYQAQESDEPFGKKMSATVDGLFNGYWLIFLSAAAVLLVTMVTYAAFKLNDDGYRKTFLYLFSTKAAIWFYLFSLYCWYLSLLDGLAGAGDFVERGRDQEESLKGRFSGRMEGAR